MQDQPTPDFARTYTAFNLDFALDAYEAASIRVVETWLDMEAYAAFGQRIDGIRAHGMSVPLLTVVCLQLVIAHSELVSTLWQDASVRVPDGRMREVRQRHANALAAVRVAAARLFRND